MPAAPCVPALLPFSGRGWSGALVLLTRLDLLGAHFELRNLARRTALARHVRVRKEAEVYQHQQEEQCSHEQNR